MTFPTWKRHFHNPGLRVTKFCVSGHGIGPTRRDRWRSLLYDKRRIIKLESLLLQHFAIKFVILAEILK